MCEIRIDRQATRHEGNCFKRPSVGGGLALTASLLFSPLMHAQVWEPGSTLWSNDFETNVPGDSTGADPAVVDGFRFNFPGGTVRGSEAFAPFGADNQYLEISPPAEAGYRLIVNGVLREDYVATPVGMSLDFNESTDPGFDTFLGFGTGAQDFQPDVNGAGSLIALGFRNGTISPGANTALVDPLATLPSFVEGQPYRITYIANFTADSHTVLGPDGDEVSLDPKQAGFWLFDVDAGSYAEPVLLENSNDRVLDTHVSFILRHFSAAAESQRQTAFVDNFEATDFGVSVPTWDGDAGDGLWSTAANWDDDALPPADGPVGFGPSADAVVTNDLPAGTSYSNLNFAPDSTPYEITGAGIGLAGNLANGSEFLQIVDLPLTLETDVTVDTGGGGIDLRGAVSGPQELTKAGVGDLTLSGANAIGGGLVIEDGELVLEGDQTGIESGFIVLNSGNATLRVAEGATAQADGFGSPVALGSMGGGSGSATMVVDGDFNVLNDGLVELLRGAEMVVSGTVDVVGDLDVTGVGGFGARLLINEGGVFRLQGLNPVRLGSGTNDNGRGIIEIDGGLLETDRSLQLFASTDFLPLLRMANGGVFRLQADLPDLILADEIEVELGAGGGVIDSNGFDAVIGQEVAGEGGLTKSGEGTLELAAGAVHAGDTAVEVGTLIVGGAGFSTAANVEVASGATLELDFAGSHQVGGLTFDGIAQAEGTWGGPGTGAENEDVRLAGSGLLEVVPAGGGFAAWASENGLSGDPDADFDGDGFGDLVEYALAGLDPTVADGSPGTFAGGVLSFEKSQLAALNGDVTYGIEISIDLGQNDPWTEVTPDLDDEETISATLDSGEPQNFARLRISLIE